MNSPAGSFELTDDTPMAADPLAKTDACPQLHVQPTQVRTQIMIWAEIQPACSDCQCRGWTRQVP
jgi:hypothetical protein